jgi:hypothetical protein
MNNPSDTIRRLADAARAAVDARALAGMSAAEVVEVTRAIEQLGRVVDGQRMAAATAIERRSARWLGTEGLAQSFGYRRGSELVEQVTGASAATVRRRIRLGESIGDRDGSLGVVLPPFFPIVANAVAAGHIGVDAARAITTELAQAGSRVPPEALQVAERLLVAQAAGRPEDVADLATAADAGMPDAEEVGDGCPGPMPADLIASQARLWRDALDPDGVEPRADAARGRRFVSVSRTPVDGLHVLRGLLTPDVAAMVQAYFDALIVQHTPTFETEAEQARHDETGQNDAGQAAVPVDSRTYDQKRHDVFAAMVRAAGAATETDAPSPAPLVIHVHAGQLELTGGTGSISGIQGRVPVSYLQQIACDGGIQLLTSRGGQVVSLSIKGRFFSPGQRRAVAVRDGTVCAVPGCDVPFAALEAHHVTPHSHGGATRVDNCVLLCWWHHHMIDAGIWSVEMVGGKPRIRVPIRGSTPLAA